MPYNRLLHPQNRLPTTNYPSPNCQDCLDHGNQTPTAIATGDVDTLFQTYPSAGTEVLPELPDYNQGALAEQQGLSDGTEHRSRG
ncbi:hypothetical protein LTR10_004764 [Elasticomyces elasticus]|nr:hypothetical protein LTR10_004764 [Elasticomyces elasticus]KAK4977081.1 hypothetical protein LTR42_003127 [Elasticomyces elasticus]